MHSDGDSASYSLEPSNDIQLFVRDGMPGGWYELAVELRDAAETLWRERDAMMRIEAVIDAQGRPHGAPRVFMAYSRPYILLAGLAIENLLKGLAVARGPTHISSGCLSRPLQTHSLEKLGTEVLGIDLDSTEMELLRVLESALPYWGRYPIPLRRTQLTEETGISEALRSSFVTLFERLEGQILDCTRHGWDSGVGPKQLPLEGWLR